MAIERANLLSMMKLSIKVLIQSSLSLGRTLDSDYPPLQQFFVVLEHCLKHGLKGTTINDVLNTDCLRIKLLSRSLFVLQPRKPSLARTSLYGDL